jgi:hypothetical protein
MKVKIRVLSNSANLITAVAYGEGTGFYQKATARAERTANGKVRVSINSVIFFYDENVTEPEEPYVKEIAPFADIKTLTVNELVKVIANGATAVDIDVQ